MSTVIHRTLEPNNQNEDGCAATIYFLGKPSDDQEILAAFKAVPVDKALWANPKSSEDFWPVYNGLTKNIPGLFAYQALAE